MNEKLKALQHATDKFWVERGLEIKARGEKTTGYDFYLNIVQVAAIKKYLSKNDCILDVGCGVGDNTIEFAKIVTYAKGLELSGTLYRIAVERKQEENVQNVDFIMGDIRAFTSQEKFSKVISIQCLVNLMSFDEQKLAINRIIDVLRSGGLYLMSEASNQGIESLNVYRERLGLTPIKASFHNNYFDENLLLAFMQDKFYFLKKDRTLATYYFISRVFHPLYVKPDEPKFDSKINKIAAEIALEFPHISDIECSPLYVFQKK